MSLGGEARVVDPVALGQYAAVRLFIERAVAVKPGFSVTNENAPAVAAHQRPSPRHAAGHRAGRGPDQDPARRRRSWSASTSSSTSSRREHATCPPGSRRCAARSPGATTCSTRGRAACSIGCRSSPSGCDVASAEAICGPADGGRRRRPRRADGARRPEPDQGRGDGRRRAALPAPRHDPGVRRRAPRGRRRGGR